MANERETERGLPFPVRGLAQPSTGEPEKGAEDEGEEIVLSPEEFAQQFGKVKVRYTVNGEEVVREAPEILKRDQLYSGRERTVETKNSEASRLLEEARRLHSEALEIKKSAGTKADEPPADPDDPKAFVAGVVKETVDPRIDRLEQAIMALVGEVAPALETTRFSQGKKVVQGYGIDVSDYDERREEALAVFERRLGRSLTEQEVGKLTPQLWAQAYLVVKAALPKKPKGEEKPKTVVKVVSEEKEGAGPSGGAPAQPRANLSRSLQDVLAGKKTMHEHLSTKIKPMAPRTG